MTLPGTKPETDASTSSGADRASQLGISQNVLYGAAQPPTAGVAGLPTASPPAGMVVPSVDLLELQGAQVGVPGVQTGPGRG